MKCITCEQLTHFPDGAYRCDKDNHTVRLPGVEVFCAKYSGGKVKQFELQYSVMREEKKGRKKGKGATR